MASQIEEIILYAHQVHSQYFGPDIRDGLLYNIARLNIPGGAFAAHPFRGRQPLAVYLPLGVSGSSARR